MKREPIDQYFREAVLEILSSSRWGAQADLARKSGIKPSTLNDILKGRSGGTEETRRAISAALEIDYEEIIRRGREIHLQKSAKTQKPRGKILPFQSELEALGKDTLAKYHLIYAKAAAEIGYPGVRDYIDRALGIAPDEYKAFEAAEISAYDLYELAKRTLIEDMEDIKKRMRRWEELTKDVKRKNIEDIF